MTARITQSNGTSVTIELTVDIEGPMLKVEEAIQLALNEAGVLATQEALKRFDSDGAPIVLGGVKWYAKAPQAKYYQTPYGQAQVRRHVYERAEGGATFCPLEQGARTLRNATPRFAKMVASKLAQGAAADVKRDLEENHGRPMTKLLAQELSAFVSAVVQAREEQWHYATPVIDADIVSIGVGVDGTCLLLCDGQWREAMTGSISLYDRAGTRHHTCYVGTAPEHGKATFYERMAREIAHVKRLYPQARVVGIADGARSNWAFLAQHVDEQIVDYYHAREYLTQAADALLGAATPERDAWLQECETLLLEDWQGAAKLVAQWEKVDQTGWSAERRDVFGACLRYFRHHRQRMHYVRYRDMGWPIGSGVTEAACKTLVKQRLCRSGMRWTPPGAQVILSLRALLLSETRWTQFWNKVSQFGVPHIATY